MRKTYKHVIWDWNGTLLDDVDIVIDSMNSLLKRRRMPLIDLETYKNIFTFPVKDYYSLLGFDFNVDSFEELATEYIEEFNSEKYCFRLFNEVEDVLNSINRKGMSQSILSACKEEDLFHLIETLGIKNYFIKIVGLNDHYANSKVERGKECLKDLGFKPMEILLIGDTIHDFEVAQEIGCDCLLISNGHQSYERLNSLNVNIISSITDIITII